MRIAQLAPPYESVPPSHYGGTERVVSTLTEELVRRGHDVTLFASGDSRTSARLVPVVEAALWHREPPYRELGPFWAIVLGKVWKQIDQFDIVHSHLDYFGFPLVRCAPLPVLHTLHGRLDLDFLIPLYQEYREIPLVSISDAQRQPVAWANWRATVYHGIELDAFTFNPHRGDYLAFLGRISPEKGLDAAIRIARRAGLPLRVAARMPLQNCDQPAVRDDQDYYEQVIRPLLRDRHVEVVGQVGGAEKNEFLRNAAALLFPIRWPEPFGLVMAEALACGVPVLAFNEGSVPEVIEHGVTGFIGTSEDDLVRAIDRLDEIDRARCRAEAERRFSPAAMVDGYERVYERLLERAERPAVGRPASIPAGPLDGHRPVPLARS